MVEMLLVLSAVGGWLYIRSKFSDVYKQNISIQLQLNSLREQMEILSDRPEADHSLHEKIDQLVWEIDNRLPPSTDYNSGD
ncbi:hypothetical protein [Sphingomonas hengshuiensis]|uniref:hypothetical protein n=1 Tax=Sphingomonas hengshuiensis TaxID=1609977 RepID=UPI000A7FE0A9|nr:hypothetical protein [Sphingomonas hengshuiensis]